KPLMLAGLSLLAVSLLLQSQIDDSTGYATLLPAFMVLGIGIALTMSPMSTAAMNAVPVAKAGVASGILSMNRMVGASLGVAVTGALFQSLFRNRLEDLVRGTSLVKWPADRMFEAVSSGQTAQLTRGASKAQADQVVHVARDSFIHALAGSMRLSM